MSVTSTASHIMLLCKIKHNQSAVYQKRSDSFKNSVNTVKYLWVQESSDLCAVLTESIEAMMKLRLLTDDGDYLVINLKRLRKNDNGNKTWKTPNGFDIQWQKVAETLVGPESKDCKALAATDPRTDKKPNSTLSRE